MTFERGRFERQSGFGRVAPACVAGKAGGAHLMAEDAGLGRSGFYRRHGKRAFDLVLVLFCAPVWVPLILILASLAMLDGGRPFYTQKRVGRRGRVFRMWKIRSMVTGADGLLREYLSQNPAARAEWEARQKLVKDPRITRFGRVLRMTSLDELPQLWNVLVGDMSLVGPRPMMTEQMAIYPGRAYYAMRPGVTGPWQVFGRGESDFLDRVQYDDRYHRDCGFALDAGLICRTAMVVIAARGA